MGLFWRRKKEDQFVSLRLNEPAVKEERVAPPPTPEAPPPAAPAGKAEATPAKLESAPATRQAAPPATPPPPARAVPEPPKPAPEPPAKAAAPPPVPSRSPFSSSILGLDRSMEELQAQEAALEQEFSARFRRAVAATRESLSERIDSVFAGAKKIDAALLDELEEALIAADIGVPTTMHVLETVRRGIGRKEINDIEALKQSIKAELLSILHSSERHGVASEATVPET